MKPFSMLSILLSLFILTPHTQAMRQTPKLALAATQAVLNAGWTKYPCSKLENPYQETSHRQHREFYQQYSTQFALGGACALAAFECIKHAKPQSNHYLLTTVFWQPIFLQSFTQNEYKFYLRKIIKQISAETINTAFFQCDGIQVNALSLAVITKDLDVIKILLESPHLLAVSSHAFSSLSLDQEDGFALREYLFAQIAKGKIRIIEK